MFKLGCMEFNWPKPGLGSRAEYYGMHRTQERGLVVDKSFKGVFTMGGRMDGMDCAVSNRDINGKVAACDLHTQPIYRSVGTLKSMLQPSLSRHASQPSAENDTHLKQHALTL